MVILQGRTYHKLDSKEIKVQHKTWTSLCWRESKNVADDNTNYQGARMVFLIMNTIDILEELRMLMTIMKSFVERFHEDVIGRRWHQVKGMMKRKVNGTRGTTQTRNQACCSRRNDMTRKIDVSLAQRRRWCSGNKDQVAQLKSAR